jgi:CDP-4-dehydro-6-deoxyglucose reductase, E1
MSIDDVQDEDEFAIYDLVEKYYQDWHKPRQEAFTPGVNPVPVSGRVYDQQEMINLTKAMLDFFLTEGDFGKEFVTKLKRVTGKRFALLCNSGSSANLLAMSAVAKVGSKVVTPLVGFPTTLNPILQTGMIPVFVDVQLGTYVPSIDDVQTAIEDNCADGYFLPHTLGNVAPLVGNYSPHFFRVFDCCDALGSAYDGMPVTAFGDINTLSFYPAHHITTGEGGAVLTSNPTLKRKIESLRDWGRDCWCGTGQDNTCNKRYEWEFEGLPNGYDHKYIYSSVGYNLKMTDLQAAVGSAQVDKLFDFSERRQQTFNYYDLCFQRYLDHFILPEATEGAEPSWFGFPITIRPNSPIDRGHLLRFLAEKKIGTRLFFGSNLSSQPAYKEYEFAGIHTPNADLITTNSLWIGVYPGITNHMREYVVDCFDEYMKGV